MSYFMYWLAKAKIIYFFTLKICCKKLLIFLFFKDCITYVYIANKELKNNNFNKKIKYYLTKIRILKKIKFFLKQYKILIEIYLNFNKKIQFKF